MTTQVPDAAAIQGWSVEYLSKLLKLPAERIDPKGDFDSFGLDSSSAVAYIMSLEEWLEIELVPELLFDFTTIVSLAEHLVTLLPQPTSEAV
jgi:acyl carrier protein